MMMKGKKKEKKIIISSSPSDTERIFTYYMITNYDILSKEIVRCVKSDEIKPLSFCVRIYANHQVNLEGS